MLDMWGESMGSPSGMVPEGTHEWAIQLCTQCAQRVGFEVGLAVDGA
jgi:hypothetical protein